MAVTLGSFFLALCLIQSASTWRTPEEWRSLIEAARGVAAAVPDSSDQFVVAPEALLYYADRRGFRLEFDPEAIRRAAGEWGTSIPEPGSPLALVDFYQRQVANLRDRPGLWYARISHIADVGPTTDGPRRRAFREAIRADSRWKTLVDRPGMLIAEIH